MMQTATLDTTELTSELDPEVTVCSNACSEQLLMGTPNGHFSHLKEGQIANT
jgi:hypothetical protein